MLALETKATKRPFAEIAGRKLGPLAWVPSLATLTRRVSSEKGRRRKMSDKPLLSPLTRLVAVELKTMSFPLAVDAGSLLGPPMLCTPPVATLIRR